MIYLTSDLHFNHDQNFIYEPRGFTSVEEMNKTIIKNFHSIIKPNDDLYILGDIMLGGNDIEGGCKLVKQLPGNIHLVWGNHDTENRKKALFKCYNVVEDCHYATVIKYEGYTFYLSHYLTLTANFDENKPLKRRIINLSGHTHSKEKINAITNSYNVALDAHNNFPVKITDIIKDLQSLDKNK